MPRSVLPLSVEKRLELGLRAASDQMYQQDKIWSRYSNDKVDIAGVLARVLRTLSKSLPLEEPLTALSIGSSNEPQFRILESACRGGLFLLDVEHAALNIVEERIQRQGTHHVRTMHGDYRELLRDEDAVRRFREEQLGDRRMTLITLHHSLYYSSPTSWPGLLMSLYDQILSSDPAAGPSAVIHAVLMANRSEDRTSTTWLYNHFAEKFFHCRNEQDLPACAAALRRDRRLAGAQVLLRESRVEFVVDDFERFMTVVWMILLHPRVHRFSEEQQAEVIEWVYENIWSQGLPLVQVQDHMVIYRGAGLQGLI